MLWHSILSAFQSHTSFYSLLYIFLYLPRYISLHRVLTQDPHLTCLYIHTKTFQGNVHLTILFPHYAFNTSNLFPVKLAFHFSRKSHILCLCCCIFRLNAPAKSTSYHNFHNQLLPSHHTRSGTHWTTTNLTPTAPKTLTYEHTLNADFGSCTCDTAMYVVLNVHIWVCNKCQCTCISFI